MTSSDTEQELESILSETLNSISLDPKDVSSFEDYDVSKIEGKIKELQEQAKKYTQYLQTVNKFYQEKNAEQIQKLVQEMQTKNQLLQTIKNITPTSAPVASSSSVTPQPQTLETVKFNVGNRIFEISKANVLKYDCLLKVLVQHSESETGFDVKKDEHGAIILDRTNIKNFELILDFLRTGNFQTIGIPSSLDERQELLDDVRYFVLDDLVTRIQLLNYTDFGIYEKVQLPDDLQQEQSSSEGDLSQIKDDRKLYIEKELQNLRKRNWQDEKKAQQIFLHQKILSEMNDELNRLKVEAMEIEKSQLERTNRLQLMEKNIQSLQKDNDKLLDQVNSSKPKERVTINVGGELFTLSMSSLLPYQSSKLYSIAQSATAEYIPFVDRSSFIFGYIYKYLNGDLLLIKLEELLDKDNSLRVVFQENVKFYELTDLIQISEEFKYPLYSIPKEDLVMKQREDYIRFLYANDRENILLEDPYLNLIPVFKHIDQFEEEIADPSLPLLFDYDKPDEYTNKRKLPSKFKLVNSLEEFKLNFAVFSHGLLEGLNWNNVFVAGGGVLAAMQEGSLSKWIHAKKEKLAKQQQEEENIASSSNTIPSKQHQTEDSDSIIPLVISSELHPYSNEDAFKMCVPLLSEPIIQQVKTKLHGIVPRYFIPNYFMSHSTQPFPQCLQYWFKIDLSHVKDTFHYQMENGEVVDKIAFSTGDKMYMRDISAIPNALKKVDWVLIATAATHFIVYFSAKNEMTDDFPICIVKKSQVTKRDLQSGTSSNGEAAQISPPILMSKFLEQLQTGDSTSSSNESSSKADGSTKNKYLNDLIQVIGLHSKRREQKIRESEEAELKSAMIIMDSDYRRGSFKHSDLDLFLYDVDVGQAESKIRHIYETICNNLKEKNFSKYCNSIYSRTNDVLIMRSKYSITFRINHQFRNIQIVLRIYKSPAEVLTGFDIDSCCVGFDGNEVYCLPRAKRSIQKRYNLVDIDRQSQTYELRLSKYASRGFRIAVPGLDFKKVKREYLMELDQMDPNSCRGYIYEANETPFVIKFPDYHNTRGLSRLLLLENKWNYPSTYHYKAKFSKQIGLSKRSKVKYIQSENGFESDYSGKLVTMVVKSYDDAAACKTSLDNYIDGVRIFCKHNENWKPDLLYSLNNLERVLHCSPFENDSILSEHIQFILKNPGSQTLMTGSFHPHNFNFYFDAYHTSRYIANYYTDKPNGFYSYWFQPYATSEYWDGLPMHLNLELEKHYQQYIKGTGDAHVHLSNHMDIHFDTWQYGHFTGADRPFVRVKDFYYA